VNPSELELRSARGERLAALRHDPEAEPRGLVVISPCFTCTRDIAPVRNLARDLAAAGFAAVRYDPFGSGKSEGRFEDATVTRYVARRRSTSPATAWAAR
jgi:putative redox protein